MDGWMMGRVGMAFCVVVATAANVWTNMIHPPTTTDTPTSISEENKLLSFEERSKWEYFWCVDPLDGTKEFIKRNGQFTVNIGLCKG